MLDLFCYKIPSAINKLGVGTMIDYDDQKTKWYINNEDLKVIRDLASEIKTISESDIMQNRISDWTAHNDLKESRPMILNKVFITCPLIL
jgi:hypothetical protein